MFLLERLFFLAAGFLTNSAIIKFLGQSQYGTFALLLNSTTIIGQITKLGVEDKIISHFAAKRYKTNEIGAYYSLKIFLTVILVLPTLLVLKPAQIQLSNWNYIVILLISICDGANFGELALHGQSKLKKLSQVGLLRSIIALLARSIVLIVFKSNLINTLLIVILIETTIYRILTTEFGKITLVTFTPLKIPKSILNLNTLTFTIFNVLYSRIDIFYASFFENNDYSTFLAATRFNEIYSFVINLIALTFVADFSVKTNRREKILLTVRYVKQFCVFYTLTLIFHIYIFAPLITRFVLTNFHNSLFTMRFTFLMLFPLFVGFAIGKTMILLNEEKKLNAFLLIGILLNITLFSILYYLNIDITTNIVFSSLIGNLIPIILSLNYLNRIDNYDNSSNH